MTFPEPMEDHFDKAIKTIVGTSFYAKTIKLSVFNRTVEENTISIK